MSVCLRVFLFDFLFSLQSGQVIVEVRQLMSDNGRVVTTRESFSSTEHVPSVFESASDE